jgi:hypothetical protein
MDPDGRITTTGIVTPAMFDLVRTKTIRPSEFEVLVVLKAMTNDQGECTVSNLLLTQACHCSLVQIKKVIAKLKKVGAIRRKSWRKCVRTLELLV